MKVSSFDLDVLARTIYGEARGEYNHPRGGISSYIAVANVVMNRVKKNTWFGNTIRDVCLKPYQFSCWNNNDPNYKIIKKSHLSDGFFHICRNVANNVSNGIWPDLTSGCDHYYCIKMEKPPKWSLGKKPVIEIGNHRFFNLSGVK